MDRTRTPSARARTLDLRQRRVEKYGTDQRRTRKGGK